MDWFEENGIDEADLETIVLQGDTLLDTFIVNPIGRNAHSFHWQRHPSDPPEVPGYFAFVQWVIWILQQPGCDHEYSN